jgi:hypothetical protein
MENRNTFWWYDDLPFERCEVGISFSLKQERKKGITIIFFKYHFYYFKCTFLSEKIFGF